MNRTDGNGYLMALATKTVIAAAVLELLFSKRAIAGTDLAFEQYKVSS